VVTIGGDALTLVGNELKAGVPAPDFEAVAPSDMVTASVTRVKLSSLRGKPVIISAVPSLDTPVCDLQTHRFISEAAHLAPEVTVMTLSMDLPYAQARWLRDKDTAHMITLSDHLDGAFGKAYGILIKELRLLARAVFIIDQAGTVRYIQVVKDMVNEPDYDEVLESLGTIGQEEETWRKA
jgi:thiol peroxidase